MNKNNIAGKREATDWFLANASNLDTKQAIRLLHNQIFQLQRVQKRLKIESTIEEYARVLNEIDGR